MRSTPQSHSERRIAVDQVSDWAAKRETPPELLALYLKYLEAQLGDYAKTRAAFKLALGAWRKTRTTGEGADTAFDRTFRLFSRSVVDEEGKAAPRRLSEGMDNTLPGDLVALPWAEEVEKTRSLLAFLQGRGDVSFNPAQLHALQGATETLAVANRAAEDAELSLDTARIKATAAMKAFDKAYARFVRALSGVVEEAELRGIVPYFPDAPEGDDEE